MSRAGVIFQHLRALSGEVDCGHAACDAHQHEKPKRVRAPAKKTARKKRARK